MNKPLSDVLRELEAQEANEAGVAAVHAAIVDAADAFMASEPNAADKIADLTKTIEDRAMGRLHARPTEANLDAVRRLQIARAFNEPISPPASGSTPEGTMNEGRFARLIEGSPAVPTIASAHERLCMIAKRINIDAYEAAKIADALGGPVPATDAAVRDAVDHPLVDALHAAIDQIERELNTLENNQHRTCDAIGLD